jgi:HEAT repeat protein
MRDDPDTAVANEAAASLAKVGRAGVPYLVAAFAHERAAVRQPAAAAPAGAGPEARAATAALLQALKNDSRQVRAVAAHALGEVRGDPRLVVPALSLALGDLAPEVRKQAGLALVSLGEDAVPSLREALKSPVPTLRRDAAQVLGQMGADAKAAAGDLALLLKDNEPPVRAAAAGAISAMGQEAQAVIPALLEAMRQEKRFEVQQQLFQALTLVGSRDLPGFLKAVREIDQQGQWATPYLLVQFGPNPEDAVKPLIKFLGDPEPGKRLAAALALGKLGLLSAQSVPALAKLLDDPSIPVRLAAVASLAKLAPGHERLAEFRITAALKQMDDFLVATAQQQRNMALMAQQRGMAVLIAEAMRPFNRRAALDPVLQAQYSRILDLYILLTPNDCPKSKLMPHGVGGLAGTMQSDVARLVSELPMEAVPAMVRSINQLAALNIGFC